MWIVRSNAWMESKMNRIVSTCQYRDYVLIFCENGDIYKMIIEDTYTWKVTFQRVAEFRPHS